MAYYKAVILDDYALKFTAQAGGVVSGGDLVMYTSTNVTLGSDASAYTGKTIGILKASGTAATAHESTFGMALANAGSASGVAVLSQGLVILPAGSNGVSGGQPVVFVGYANMVEKIGTGSLAATAYPIGRALTGATDNTGFVLVRLNC